MSIKTELTEKFKNLLLSEDIASIKEDVRGVLSEFNAETSRERKEQEENWENAEHEEGEEFEFQQNALDEEFESIVAEYRERVKELRGKIAAEQKENYDKKRILISELEKLVSEEEHIGKAFAEFKRIQEAWGEIGHVTSEKHKELMDEFIKHKDHFYYTINIYKQLQEHDLKKNEDKKRDLIKKVAKVKEVESIREADNLVRQYQKEWMDIGPVSKDNYQALADEFFGTCREIIGRIREHYDKLREKQGHNLELKKTLIQKAKDISELDISNHPTWMKKTDEILALQTEWKTIGFVSKEENDAIWNEFRTACDVFFNRKQEYYSKRKEIQKASKEKKEALVLKAEEIQNSIDWRKTGDQLIALQKEWKEVGSASQRDEQRLWQKFRNACDTFFNARKEQFASQDQIQNENLKNKRTLIEEIVAFQLTENTSEDVVILKEFSKRWHEYGYVPRKNMKEVSEAYGKALDEKYQGLNIERQERNMNSYQQRVENLKNSEDSARQVKREKALLRDKMDRLNERVRQIENNIELFTGAGAEGMRKEYTKKIQSSKREIEEIRNKLKMF